MKKEYVSPIAYAIELKMNENIAVSNSQVQQKTGSWSFQMEEANNCFEYVTSSDIVSGYTDWDSMSGFSATYYIMTLLKMYGSNKTDEIWALCGL